MEYIYNPMAWRAIEVQRRRDPSLAGSYTPPPNKPTSVHLSPTASSRNPKTIGMPKAPIEYAHEIKQCTFSPRVREAASFFERRGDGVPVDDTQARSHGQGQGAARADRRRAIQNRRRAAPGRDEARGSVARRSTSKGGNIPAAPEPPDVAVLGGRQAAFTSTISTSKGRDARPEARRRPRGVLLQAAPRRAVPRVHPRHGRRVAGVQARGARAAAAAEADVLPRPGLSRFSCGYCVGARRRRIVCVDGVDGCASAPEVVPCTKVRDYSAPGPTFIQRRAKPS